MSNFATRIWQNFCQSGNPESENKRGKRRSKEKQLMYRVQSDQNKKIKRHQKRCQKKMAYFYIVF